MKTTTLIATVIFAAMALCACAPSTESSDWLKGTTWKADLAGIQYHFNGPKGFFDYQTLEEGSITIHFTTNGYKLQIDSKSLEELTVTKMFPDYDFPTLYFPISWKEENKQPVDIIYNTGTMSEDFKTIHFETFRDKGHDWGDYVSYNEFKDLVFTRE